MGHEGAELGQTGSDWARSPEARSPDMIFSPATVSTAFDTIVV
jgi:hypothetical protein